MCLFALNLGTRIEDDYRISIESPGGVEMPLDRSSTSELRDIGMLASSKLELNPSYSRYPFGSHYCPAGREPLALPTKTRPAFAPGDLTPPGSSRRVS